MLESYLPIVILIGASTMLAVGMLVLSALFGRSAQPRAGAKLYPYECGIEVQGSPRQRFSVRFYVVAMLFILFDLETAFLLPWAVIYRRLGLFGLVEMFVFLGILLAGYLYAWRKGGFEW
jgi:NADH-quinone oxidoreductase subunit A